MDSDSVLELIDLQASTLFISEVDGRIRYIPWKLKSSVLTAGHSAVAISEGNAVSICSCARVSLWAAEAGAETVKVFRGLRYASAAVATWSKAVQDQANPTYSTSW
jgi:hypothetical protein